MCHHRMDEYTRLYEVTEKREELPEWAEEPEEIDAAADEPEPFSPGTAD